MRLSLQRIYYYSFLSSFCVILFSNLIPSKLVVITRLFVLFTAALSILLLNDIKSICIIMLFYLFLLIYFFFPLINNSADIGVLLNNTKYSLYFVFLFGLVNILRFITVDSLLYSMSRFFVLKLCFVGIVSLNMNLGIHLFKNYILNGIDLSVHQLFGAWRVLDMYLTLFPLVFFYIKKKRKVLKILIHSLLFFNIVSSLTFGIIFAYLIVMFFRYRFVKLISLIFLFLVFLVYRDFFDNLCQNIIMEKSISIEVKFNQLRFLFDNITLFGQGLGKTINIDGRIDTMLENIYIYWVIVYGVIGTTVMGIFFILFPFYICYRNKNKFPLRILFYSHLSSLIVGASNPYLESVMGIIPLILIVSFYFSKNKTIYCSLNKKYNTFKN